MKATISPIYRWRVGEVENHPRLEFEAALLEPAVIHPEKTPGRCSTNWREPATASTEVAANVGFWHWGDRRLSRRIVGSLGWS